MPSVRQIAEEAGVSIATVSRVLNENPQVSLHLREKVQAVVQRRGAVERTAGADPGDNLARGVFRSMPEGGGPTGAVGGGGGVHGLKIEALEAPAASASTTMALLYTAEPTLLSPFDAAVLHGMLNPPVPVPAPASGGSGLCGGVQVLRASDLLAGCDDAHGGQRGARLAARLQRLNVGGVVVRTTHATRALAEALSRTGFPMVTLSDVVPGADSLAGDGQAAASDLTAHLLAIGHTRLGLVRSPIRDHDHDRRVAGFEAAIAQAGIGMDQVRVFECWPHRRGGEAAMNQILTEQNQPTAVLVTDMGAALGMLKRAQEIGVDIPRKLSIATFDDNDLRFSTHPILTASCQSAADMGARAAGLLRDRIRQPFAPICEQLPAEDAAEALAARDCRRADTPTWLEVHRSTARPETAAD